LASPGLAGRIVETGARCPTFSWQQVVGAANYELVAYRLPDTVEPAAVTSAELVPESEVLYARVPGGATSWTPALDQCLASGGSYVWFVRGIHENESGEEAPGDWSEGLFFAVSAGLSREEVAEAMRVLQRYVGVDVSAGVERNPRPHHEQLQQSPSEPLRPGSQCQSRRPPSEGI
jgi:hypothetical protein